MLTPGKLVFILYPVQLMDGHSILRQETFADMTIITVASRDKSTRRTKVLFRVLNSTVAKVSFFLFMYSCATYSPINTLSTRVCFMWALSSTFRMIHSKIISSTLWSRLQMFARWAPACDLLVIKIGVWSRKESKKNTKMLEGEKHQRNARERESYSQMMIDEDNIEQCWGCFGLCHREWIFFIEPLMTKKSKKRWQILVETRRYWQQPIIVFVWHHP